MKSYSWTAFWVHHLQKSLKCAQEGQGEVVRPCGRCSPGFPGDGGSWLWPVWRWRKGQLPNRLPEDCGRHGTGTATDLQQRRGATSPLWGVCPPDATRTRAWDRGPEIQCYTHPGWIWTRKVSSVSSCLAHALTEALNPKCFHFLVTLVFCFHKPICLRTWATNQILLPTVLPDTFPLFPCLHSNGLNGIGLVQNNVLKGLSLYDIVRPAHNQSKSCIISIIK